MRWAGTPGADACPSTDLCCARAQAERHGGHNARYSRPPAPLDLVVAAGAAAPGQLVVITAPARTGHHPVVPAIRPGPGLHALVVRARAAGRVPEWPAQRPT